MQICTSGFDLNRRVFFLYNRVETRDRSREVNERGEESWGGEPCAMWDCGNASTRRGSAASPRRPAAAFKSTRRPALRQPFPPKRLHSLCLALLFFVPLSSPSTGDHDGVLAPGPSHRRGRRRRQRRPPLPRPSVARYAHLSSPYLVIYLCSVDLAFLHCETTTEKELIHAVWILSETRTLLCFHASESVPMQRLPLLCFLALFLRTSSNVMFRAD